MKNTYFDLIEQSYYFPQEGFDLRDNCPFTFHGVSIKYLIEKYGTPFRLMYLPRIGDQIKKARNLFNRAIKANNYAGDYNYCYCTKCCHFHHVIGSALKQKVHLETSSSFDIDLIEKLIANGEIHKTTKFIHNGYKTDDYIQKIMKIQKSGHQSIIVIDNRPELTRFIKQTPKGSKIKIGVRMAIDEESQSSYYTSRLGLRSSEIIEFFKNEILGNDKVELKMLHFFVDSGIDDTFYSRGEFQKAMKIFVELKKMLFQP